MLTLSGSPAVAEQSEPTDSGRDFEVQSYLDGAYSGDAYRDDDAMFAAARGGLLGFVTIQLNAWFPELSGDMSSGTGSVNLDGDLGIDSTEVVVLPVITVNISRFGARIDGFLAEYDGSASLGRAIEFGGVNFQSGENVASDFKISQVRALFLYSFVNSRMLSLTAEAGVIGTRIEGTMVGQTSGTASRQEDIILPAIGLLAEAKVLFFAFEAEVTGMSLGSGDTIVDVRVSAAWSPLFFSFRIGYRHLLLDLESSGFGFDGYMSGGFIGVGIQF